MQDFQGFNESLRELDLNLIPICKFPNKLIKLSTHIVFKFCSNIRYLIYITNLYWWDIEVHLQNTKVNGKYLKLQLPFLHFYWHCLNIGIRYKLKKTNFLRSNCYHHNKLKLLKTNLKDNFFQGRNETLCFRLKNYVHLSWLLIHWKINQK